METSVSSRVFVLAVRETEKWRNFEEQKKSLPG